MECEERQDKRLILSTKLFYSKLLGNCIILQFLNFPHQFFLPRIPAPPVHNVHSSSAFSWCNCTSFLQIALVKTLLPYCNLHQWFLHMQRRNLAFCYCWWVYFLELDMNRTIVQSFCVRSFIWHVFEIHSCCWVYQ